MIPRISLVVPCYNEEQYLPETIPAILGQTMGDFELIVVNNGSTDRSAEILRSFSDARLAVVDLPTNAWPSTAGKVGVALADRRSMWLLGHGADDLMDEDYLDAILNGAAAHPEVNCIFSPWRWIGLPQRGIHVFPPYDPDTITNVHQIPAWCARSWPLWDATGEDEAIRIGSDWDWAVRASVLGLLNPLQLERPYIALRERTGRVSLSHQVDFVKLNAHMKRHTREEMATWNG